MPQPTQYEPWMHDAVAKVREMTFPPMMTLRCPETADLLPPEDQESCRKAPPFGVSWAAKRPKGEAADSTKGLFHKRRIEVKFRTPVFPLGVPLGVRDTFKKVQNHNTDEEKEVIVGTSYDISMPQLEALDIISKNKKLASDADRRASQALITAAELNARKDKLDPEAADLRKAKVMARALVEAGALTGGVPAPASLADVPDDEFEAEAVKRRMAKARAARGKKPDAVLEEATAK